MGRVKEFFISLLRTAVKDTPSVVIDEPDLIRKQQIKKIGVAGVVMLAAGLLLAFAFKGFTETKVQGKTRPHVKLVQDRIGTEIKQAEDLGEIKYLQDENKKLKDDLEKLKESLLGRPEPQKAPERNGIEKLAAAILNPGKGDEARLYERQGSKGAKGIFIPPEPPARSGPLPQFVTNSAPRLPFSLVQASNRGLAAETAVSNSISSIRVFGESTRSGGSQGKKTWIPSGSFVQGQLLSGLDAPTGGYSQSNPHPVLIRINDLAILPGRQRMDIKECFVVGAGYGDLASERAYVRTESLSCVKKDRSTIDVPVKGYVVGEDGKVGLRGRVVSKQGQLLARSLLAGFASGMSDAFKPITPTYYISADDKQAGKMVFPEARDVLQAGAFGGMSKALDRLAHFYIDMAKQVFPIIEIDAGRNVEVVVLKGMELTENATDR